MNDIICHGDEQTDVPEIRCKNEMKEFMNLWKCDWAIGSDDNDDAASTK